MVDITIRIYFPDLREDMLRFYNKVTILFLLHNRSMTNMSIVYPIHPLNKTMQTPGPSSRQN